MLACASLVGAQRFDGCAEQHVLLGAYEGVGGALEAVAPLLLMRRSDQGARPASSRTGPDHETGFGVAGSPTSAEDYLARSGGRYVSMSDQPDEAYVQRELVRMFDDIDHTQATLDNADSRHFDVHPRSPLAADNRKTDPFQVSHEAAHLTVNAVGHLHAIGCLIRESKALHNGPPFALARASIESSASVVWMLSPANRSTRIKRRLSLALQDAYDADKAAREIGNQNTTLNARLDRLTEIVRTATGDREIPRLWTTTVVKEAEAAAGVGFRPMLVWRVGSGFSHGRLWTDISMLDREEFPTDEAGVVRARLSNNLTRVWWACRAAHEMLLAASRLYRQRASCHVESSH